MQPDDGARSIVAILGFHKIGAPPSGGWNTWFYIPERTFAGFLQCLKDDGWHVLDLTSFLAGLGAPERVPKKSVLLTFDDGYRSMKESALPWLRRFDYPAVLFVPTDFIGKINSFDTGLEPMEPICDWDDLRELERQGISVQSHGASHPRFSALSPCDLEEEFVRSKSALEAGLDKSVEMFAYPYGDAGADPRLTARILERTGYRAACLYDGGLEVLPATDVYRLSRLPMGPDTDLQAALDEG